LGLWKRYINAVHLSFTINLIYLLKKKKTVLFSNDALDCSKVTVNKL